MALLSNGLIASISTPTGIPSGLRFTTCRYNFRTTDSGAAPGIELQVVRASRIQESRSLIDFPHQLPHLPQWMLGGVNHFVAGSSALCDCVSKPGDDRVPEPFLYH